MRTVQQNAGKEAQKSITNGLKQTIAKHTSNFVTKEELFKLEERAANKTLADQLKFRMDAQEKELEVLSNKLLMLIY